MSAKITMLILAAAVVAPVPAVDWEQWFARHINGELSYRELEDVFMDMDFEVFDAAQTLYLKGLVALREGDQRVAEENLAEADRILTETGPPSTDAEALRLLADVRAQLMLLKGLGYIIRHARGVESLAKAAFAIDPRNSRAAAIVAQGKINAPRAFGGDPTDALRMLTPYLVDDTLADTERFLILWTLAAAEIKLKNPSKARGHLEAALALFPGSPEARELLREL